MKITCIPLLFFVIAAQAQEHPIPISLSECISRALEKNPVMTSSKAKVRSADARFSEMNAALLPQLKLSGRADRLSGVPEMKLPPPFNLTLFPSITENYDARIILQQPLFMGFRLLKNREMAELQADAMRADSRKDNSDLILSVTTAYWNLYQAMKVEEVMRQSIEQVTEHVKDIQSYAKQGMATDADVMKVQVQLSGIKVKEIQARNAIRLATINVNILLSNPLETQLVPSDDPAVMNSESQTWMEMNLDQVATAACAQRPEVKSMELKRTMSEAGVSAAQGGWYPQIYLMATYDYARPNQRILPPKDQWDGTWDLGVSFQWNIWDWMTTKHQTIQAEEALRQSEAGLAQVRDAVALDAAQQSLTARTSREEIEAARDGVEQAKESYRITSEKFKAGYATSSDLLDAETALLQAKLTHTQAVIGYALSLARLKKALGAGQ